MIVRYKLYYTNRDIKIKTFESVEMASWYIYNEGDHLVRVEKC